MKVLKKRKALLLLLAAVIAALAFVGCQTQSEVKQGAGQPAAQADTTDAAPTAAPTAPTAATREAIPEDLRGFTEYTVKEQLGEKSNGGKDRLKKLETEGSGKESSVIVELNGNDAFSDDMTVRGMLMDSKKILEPLSERKDVEQVSISEYLDVEDIGGGTVEEWVFTLTMDRKGLDKVASGDYMLNDLCSMAVEYKLHPNFMK